MEVKEFIEIAVPVLGIPAAGIWLFKHHFDGHNHAKRLLTFKNLDESMTELDQMRKAKNIDLDSEWSLYQNLVHCAQSIEYSMTGYPETKSKIFQNTVGSLVFHQFEKQGYMRHNRNEPLPGATPIEAEGSMDEASARLTKAIHDFDQYDGELHPHFAFGKLNKSQYANVHCMHLADHFAMVTYSE